MDKNYHKKESLGFMGEGSCYIHTEMKNGHGCETVLCGDFLAMLWGISAQIERVSQLTNTTFTETINAINNIRQLADEVDDNNPKFRKVNKKKPIQVIDGQDWQEEWIADKEKQYEKKYSKLKNEIKKYQAEIETAQELVKAVKRNYELKFQVLTRDKDDLQREIDRLEHRLKEMEEGHLISFKENNDEV